MKKIDETVKKETIYILAVTIIFSLLMQSIFLIIGKWDYTVLLGNLLGIVADVGNFLVMGISIQNALGREEKEAKNLIKLSQTLRMLALFVIAMIGYLVPIFNIVAVFIPYLFPRLAISLRPLLIKER